MNREQVLVIVVLAALASAGTAAGTQQLLTDTERTTVSVGAGTWEVEESNDDNVSAQDNDPAEAESSGAADGDDAPSSGEDHDDAADGPADEQTPTEESSASTPDATPNPDDDSGGGCTVTIDDVDIDPPIDREDIEELIGAVDCE